MADGTVALPSKACGPKDSLLTREKNFRVFKMPRPLVVSRLSSFLIISRLIQKKLIGVAYRIKVTFIKGIELCCVLSNLIEMLFRVGKNVFNR